VGDSPINQFCEERKSVMEMKIAKRYDDAAEKKLYLRDQLVTIGDLRQFRENLLNDLKQIIFSQHPVYDKKWLKSHEVRKLLKISPGTLQNLRNKGSLKFTKVGGIIYYSYDDIVRMLEKQSGFHT
jgi:5-bromo-4-chloroindolyl phosphate hydrolysis protein